MKHRVVVSVATDSWVAGQSRLIKAMSDLGENTLRWSDSFPRGCPPHRTRGFCSASREHDCRPYAFKAYALREATGVGYTSLLWCDSCIVPVRPLAELWERIETDGYWICKNGWSNASWTAESAYEDLFVLPFAEEAISMNRNIEHVVATAFGITMEHPIGRAFLDEYFRLASTTRAFCGPWQNSNAPTVPGRNLYRPAGPCGPEWVLGHRHDQTAASVIAWRLGMKLDEPQNFFAYAGGETERTILIAK